jgi:hypothetical protein
LHCADQAQPEPRRWTAAAPSQLAHAAVPDSRADDTIHLGHRTLRVVGVRDDDADQPPVLVVEDVAE